MHKNGPSQKSKTCTKCPPANAFPFEEVLGQNVHKRAPDWNTVSMHLPDLVHLTPFVQVLSRNGAWKVQGAKNIKHSVCLFVGVRG